MRVVRVLLASFSLLLAAVPAQAQTFPVKTVRIIVGFAPGGATDLTARVLAPKMTEALGQSVVVENRPGASGMIAAELVAKSSPDGHTLIMATQTTHVVAPSLYRKMGARGEGIRSDGGLNLCSRGRSPHIPTNGYADES